MILEKSWKVIRKIDIRVKIPFDSKSTELQAGNYHAV